MGSRYERLLEAMPLMAERVKAFESESTRQQALTALLDAFIDDHPTASHRPQADGEVRVSEPTRAEGDQGPAFPNGKAAERPGWEQQVLENLPDAHDVAEHGGRNAQTIWAIVTLFSRDQEATNNTIRDLIKAELGIAPEARTNLGTRLQELTPKYITRQKVGRSYRYAPTRGALEVFKGMDSDE